MTSPVSSLRSLGVSSLGAVLLLAGGAFALMGMRNAPDDPPPALDDGVFRACALSQDMPLSTEDPDEYSGREGLYIDLAKAMADRQDASFQSHFAVTAFYKRPVREGLLADKCDAYFGLPRSDGDWFVPGKVALTKSFMSIGYALAVPSGTAIDGLEDLKGKTVAVQGGSPGAIAVSYVEGISTRTYRFATPALKDLEEGSVDAAFVWGPKAGYYATHIAPDAFDVHPTTLQWPVAIGVRAADREAMVPRLESLIDKTKPVVADLKTTYGFPSGDPIEVELRGPTALERDADDEDTSSATSSAASVEGIGKSADHALIEQTLLKTVAYADTTEGDPEKGQQYFNSTYGCAHCHGTNAQGATSGTNLRLLENRYGDEARATFFDTVRNGRDGTAMPPWEGVISEGKMNDIWSFLASIQETE